MEKQKKNKPNQSISPKKSSKKQFKSTKVLDNLYEDARRR
jgi:hypothetical protein